MENNLKAENVQQNKLIQGLKILVVNAIIFIVIDLVMFRLFHLKYNFITFAVYTIVTYLFTSSYRDTLLENKEITSGGFYFWGLIMPLLLGYGIYNLVWDDELMSNYDNIRGVLDTVFIYDGTLKGVIMTILLNTAAVSSSRILVLIGVIVSDIKNKSKSNKQDDDTSTTKERIGNPNSDDGDKQSDSTNNSEATTEKVDSEFFKGVKNVDELKKRYHDLLKIYHPDNNAGDSDVTRRIKEEYEAFNKEFSNN